MARRDENGNGNEHEHEENDARREALLDAVRLLAADAEVQVAALGTLRAVGAAVVAGAQTSNDPPPRLEAQLAETGELSETARLAVDALDDVFAELLLREAPAHWTAEAVRTDPLWAKGRALARRALMALNN